MNTMREHAIEMTHQYYIFPDGELVSKRLVDAAFALINRMAQGAAQVEISDDMLFLKGNMTDAVMRFHNKYNTSVEEAKAAIERMRGEIS